ncbi:MAG: hypothetical protein LBG92_06990 [Prevotellaceae bacterium]|nr:hypothetical protein [Prevotellaceae bacterium]
MKRISLKLVLPSIVFYCMFSCTGVNNDRIEPLYNLVPDIMLCKKGEISEQEKTKVVKHVNSIRKMYNLPDVTYSTSKDKDAIAQSAALVIASKGELSPVTSDDNCYSDEAHQGWIASAVSFWGSANSKWTTSEYHIDDCLIDNSSEMATVYRRRGILDPFLQTISFGRVIGSPKRGNYKYVSAAALLVKGFIDADLTETAIPEYIAFPEGNLNVKYLNSDMFMSFSVLCDKTSKIGNKEVDFSNATVEVSSGSIEFKVSSISYDNDNFGLPNNLQWKIEGGLVKNITYTVKISNVNVVGDIRDYIYSFSFR